MRHNYASGARVLRVWPRAALPPCALQSTTSGLLSVFKSAAAMETEGETLAEWLGACALVRSSSPQ